MNDVELHLMQEDAAELLKGNIKQHDTSSSSFILVGIELEDLQYVLL